MAEKLVFEKYTLTLTHGIYEMGGEYMLEDPITVSFMTEVRHGQSPYIINDMMKRLEQELFCRFINGEEK